jgi:DNA-nicking Smr family endonuclease
VRSLQKGYLTEELFLYQNAQIRPLKGWQAVNANRRDRWSEVQPDTKPSAEANHQALPPESVAADETRNFAQLIADISRDFVRATIDEIDSEIIRCLKRVCLLLGVDRSTLAQITR